MARVIRDSDHVPKMRRKAMQKTALWIAVMAVLLIVGLVLNQGDKRNVFTMLAIVCALPIAQFAVTILGYSGGYSSGYSGENRWDSALAEQIKALPDSNSVFLNCIAVTEKKRIFLDYIIINGAGIYLFAQERVSAEEIADLEQLWLKKGIDCPVTVVYPAQWPQTLEALAKGKDGAADSFYIAAVGNLLM